jgi:hypothetical protein
VPRTLRVLLLLAGIIGCAPVDRASVLVAPPRAPATPFPAASLEPGVRDTFEQFTRGNGYSCHRSATRVGRYVCRGPKDLHLTFEQRLNGAGYVAGFSWVRSEDRSAAEFRDLVREFGQSLQGSGATVEVRMGRFAE